MGESVFELAHFVGSWKCTLTYGSTCPKQKPGGQGLAEGVGSGLPREKVRVVLSGLVDWGLIFVDAISCGARQGSRIGP